MFGAGLEYILSTMVHEYFVMKVHEYFVMKVHEYRVM